MRWVGTGRALQVWPRGRATPHVLRAGLLASAIYAAASGEDPRDTMIGLALHYDVAERLGVDPAAVFCDVAAQIAEAHIGGLLRDFGDRDDITLPAFGWRYVETPNGPDYALGEMHG